MRGKSALVNMIVGLFYEAILAISGMIIPRLILVHYGSSVNGMISSIAQFLSLVVLLKSGVGGVTRAALYYHLVNKDKEKISKVLKSTQNFMRSISRISLLGMLVLSLTFYFFVSKDFSWLFTFSLVLILGVGTFSQYYFGITYQLLLQADQKLYIWNIIQIISTLGNLAISILLINSGASIHIVKFFTVIIYSITPIISSFIVKSMYGINMNVEPDEYALSQKWDAFGYQIATYIHENTDIILLTAFSSIKMVSVYSVYSLVVNSSIRKIIENIFGGFDAALGNMWVKKEYDILDETISIYEFLSISVSSLLFSLTLVLLPSFIQIYTNGILDANYVQPVFMVLLILGSAVFCLRMPYYSLITAIGHYKQTKLGAIMEAVINVLISVLMIWQFGLVGVAIGTLIAMTYRYIYLYLYTSKHILKRDSVKLLRYYFSAFAIFLITLIFKQVLPEWFSINLLSWLLYAFVLFIIVFSMSILSSLMICNKESIQVIKRIHSIIFKKYEVKI